MCKTKFFIIAFLLNNLGVVFSQNDSIPIGRVIYLQQANTQGDIQNNGYSTLLFNNVQSIYIQNGATVSDSSFSSPEYYFPVTILGDREGFPILKRHLERKLYCKTGCRQAREHCILSDTLGGIDWKLEPDKKRLGTYECRKASGRFRGRDYEVWYTLDIPIPSGPFKLGGLPGLILEAQSKDGQVKFLFSQLEISNRIQGKIDMPHGNNLGISYAEFMKEEMEFSANLEKEFRAQGIDMHVGRGEFIELDVRN